jgi:hypothetical protein
MKALKKFMLALPLCLGMSLGAFAQNTTDEGVRLVESRDHMVTYEIKVKGMFDLSHATRLDENFKSKEGVISSLTNASTGICRVQVKEGFDSALFTDIVEFTGFTIAKAFEE